MCAPDPNEIKSFRSDKLDRYFCLHVKSKPRAKDAANLTLNLNQRNQFFFRILFIKYNNKKSSYLNKEKRLIFSKFKLKTSHTNKRRTNSS